MTSWILGDVHGCADELDALLERLALGPEDRLYSCGDLFHRGPDPAGVMDRLTEARASWVLGNHERAVLRRVGLAPRRPDAADRPERREDFPPLDADDLAGDGRLACALPAERRADFLRFLQTHAGYSLSSEDLEHAGPTLDGRPWRIVHAGISPRGFAESSVNCLTTIRRLDRRGKPWWYESYDGDELVLFGHTHAKLPRAHRSRGRLVALGLDTGCVYGGTLSAYSPELDELVSVPAFARYAG